jgi:hypothetical protein
LAKIENADLIVCDLSSNNPNVFLELAWALRADRPYILVKDDLTEYNFDLNSNYTFDYSHQLQPRILKQDMQRLTEAIRQTLADGDRRYSLVEWLSVKASAIRVSKSDPNMELLVDIHRIISEVTPTGSTKRLDPGTFVWPRKLSRANELLLESAIHPS